MAGFVNKNSFGTGQNVNPVRSFIHKLANLGMEYSDEVLRNIRSVPIDTVNKTADNEAKQLGIEDTSLQLAFAQLSSPNAGFNFGLQTDVNNMESYVANRTRYRQFAMEDDVEEILDVICDESIVFDNSRKAASIGLNTDMSKELVNELKEIYNTIYNYFGFYDLNKIWNLYRRWLVDGLIAFEIIYNDRQTDIISFVELDPTILTSSVDIETGENIWYVNAGNAMAQRVLVDSQIIYIKYAASDSVCKISYVARLVRAFNILRIMEATRIIFAVTNASYKIQYIIPTGRVGSKQSLQTLQETASRHRELVDFDWNSGEITTNGKPMLQFYKQIFMASNGGETPQIQHLGGEGPQLNDTDTLKYFRDKLRQASKIPFSRFDHDNGGGAFASGAEGRQYDEKRFTMFINRLRNTFQEILLKPVYQQMCINHHALLTDPNFKVNLYLQWADDNSFVEAKKVENIQKRSDIISSLYQNISTTDSEGNQAPFFDLDFLIHQYSGFTDEELQLNEDYKKRKKLKSKGYKTSDIEKIMDGESESKFKPVKKEKKDDESGETVEGGGGGEDRGRGAPEPPAGGISGL